MKLIDQTGQEIHVAKFPPKRIISLVPSQTELLWYLGLENETVGITKFCIHPDEWFKSKERVGGTKTLNLDKIISLNPDLIIANKEENTEAEIKALCKEFPTYISDINSVEESYKMITDVGLLTNKGLQANALVDQIKAAWNIIPKGIQSTVAYFIWNEPMMVAGRNTYINDVLTKLGFKNLFNQETSRYPAIDEVELQKALPDYVFLSTEPFPFNEQYVIQYQKLMPSSKVVLVDGEMFSWYGNRQLEAISYFKEFLIKM